MGPLQSILPVFHLFSSVDVTFKFPLSEIYCISYNQHPGFNISGPYYCLENAYCCCVQSRRNPAFIKTDRENTTLT